MNLFVTGIGTNVGKTIVSAIFTEALQADYWKPIQSGVVDGKDSETVKSFISNSNTFIHPETYLLNEPLSPHFAAKLDGVVIELDKIQTEFIKLNLSLLAKSRSEAKHLIIEGAGGLLVPINQTEYVIDIAKKIECEIVLVINNYLGCINHSLLSINYLIKNNFKINCLVFNGVFEYEVKQAIINYAPHILTIDIPNIAELSKSSILNIVPQIKTQLKF